MFCYCPSMRKFQSTPSAWRETIRMLSARCPGSFQSTPSAWRETLTQHRFASHCVISIHSLRMEGDPDCTKQSGSRNPFQSTPSAWRETPEITDNGAQRKYFNPLPPHGGRHLFSNNTVFSSGNFNPLPPHGGRLVYYCIDYLAGYHFNPHPPHGGRLMKMFF